MLKHSMFVSVTLALILTGVQADEGKDESGKRRSGGSSQYRESGGDASYFHRHGYSRLTIPKGHYPPTGQCRIWYPDSPSGQQPPPGNCERLRREVAPGAWLIKHPEEDEEHVHIAVYDERRRGVIKVVGEFEIASGVFVKVVLNR